MRPAQMHFRHARAAFPWILALCLSALAPAANAQYQIQQDGRLFDVNPQIGSGGLNYSRPVSVFVPGNAAATGNLRGGYSLRINSPISDPNSFRTPLGSSTLSAFRRDSISVADRSAFSPGYRYTYAAARPYYDPSLSAPTAGLLKQSPLGFTTQRRALEGTTPIGDPIVRPIDNRLDPRVQAPTISPRYADGRVAVDTTVTSSIFGVSRFTGLQNDVLSLAPPTHETKDQAVWFGPRESDQRAGQRVNEPLLGPRDLLATQASLSELLQQRDETAPTIESLLTLGVEQTPSQRETPTVSGERAPAEVDRPRVVEASVMPGFDTFADMRMALALQRDPQAEWFDQMKEDIAATPELEGQAGDVAEMEGEEFAARVLDTPLASLAGKGRSSFNSEMMQAEALLDVGHYFEAAARYEIAEKMDPGNPLPTLGRAHALLAAGNYNVAAVLLVRALERFPDLAQFQIDLQALMGGGEIVDIRRADLMRRLDNQEDARLRFLLGYLEYHGGEPEKGLANLKKAAAQVSPTSIIARYYDMLNSRPKPTQKTAPSAPRDQKRDDVPAELRRDAGDLIIPPPVNKD